MEMIPITMEIDERKIVNSEEESEDPQELNIREAISHPNPAKPTKTRITPRIHQAIEYQTILIAAINARIQETIFYIKTYNTY